MLILKVNSIVEIKKEFTLGINENSKVITLCCFMFKSFDITLFIHYLIPAQ